jgi:ABC-2 type transport system permease protein/oleandomycin transport system permease protein
VLACLTVFVLFLIYGFAFEWIFVLAGMTDANAQAAQNIGFVVLSATFVSSAHVPVSSVPGLLRGFANKRSAHGRRRAVAVRCSASRRPLPPRLGGKASDPLRLND